MLPRRPVEVLCFRRTEIPGKEGAKAIRCRESRSKAYACQESGSTWVGGSVVPPQLRGLDVCRAKWLGCFPVATQVMRDLGTLPGDQGSIAYLIDDRGGSRLGFIGILTPSMGRCRLGKIWEGGVGCSQQDRRIELVPRWPRVWNPS